MKQVALFDTECYRNYWLLKVRPIGFRTIKFEIRNGDRFTFEQIDLIRNQFKHFQTISFYGIYYDVPMIAAALSGYNTEQLKWLSDKLIVDKVKPWELQLPDWKPDDHIDLMNVAPGAGGQKQYGARIHSKKIQDLPYDPHSILTLPQMEEVSEYCDVDLDVLHDLYNELQPQIKQRIRLSGRYGLDLRSKSDAQLAESVLKHQCEKAFGRKIYKPDIDWNLKFRYEPPEYIAFKSPVLLHAFNLIKDAVFMLGGAGSVQMPPQLDGLTIPIGQSVYRLGIGGLHSSESSISHYSDDQHVLRDNDVVRYYPQLIINSGKYPLALGNHFTVEFQIIADDRLAAKRICKQLEKAGITNTVEYENAKVDDEGGKIMINGTFGKTGSPYSILFAPTMLIQTTITGQLSLLMLIEWHEYYGISVVSANTDGIVIKCRRDMTHVSEALIAEWQRRTGLEMETVEYKSIHSRDVNNYFAVKSDGKVKRKGEYAKSGLVAKKNPDVEICSDAVSDYLSQGVPLLYTIASCRDIRKFITMTKVKGGGVKMWGEGPIKGTKVRDMLSTIRAHGWIKEGRKWRKGAEVHSAQQAYESCFDPQAPEYLGKVARWYYSTSAPGPIVYADNGNNVSLSYGGRPCMTLPDEFPSDIDYDWYLKKCEQILIDIAVNKSNMQFHTALIGDANESDYKWNTSWIRTC